VSTDLGESLPQGLRPGRSRQVCDTVTPESHVFALRIQYGQPCTVFAFSWGFHRWALSRCHTGKKAHGNPAKPRDTGRCHTPSHAVTFHHFSGERVRPRAWGYRTSRLITPRPHTGWSFCDTGAAGRCHTLLDAQMAHNLIRRRAVTGDQNALTPGGYGGGVPTVAPVGSNP